MAIRLITGTVGTGLSAEETEQITRLLTQAGRVTLLVPSFAVRDVCRHELARAGVGVGVDVATPDTWTVSLWELLGDERRLVSEVERRLLVAGVLSDAAGAQAGSTAAITPGVVALYAHAAKQSLPYALARASSTSGLSAAEREVVRVLKRYDEQLRARALIEPATAAVQLAQVIQEVVPACTRAIVLHALTEIPEHTLELLGACARAGEVVCLADERAASVSVQLEERFSVRAERRALDADSGVPGSRGGVALQHLRFAEVSGPSARDAAYTQLIVDAAQEGETVVAAPQPYAAFQHLAPRLAARGISTSVEDSVRFAATRAGEALFMLLDLLDRMDREETGAWWPAPELTDWVRSPFSGVWSGSTRQACLLDKALRSSRLVDAEGVLASIRSLQSNEVRLESEYADDAGVARRPVVVFTVLEELSQGAFSKALAHMLAVAREAPQSAFGMEGAAAKQVECAALTGALACFSEAERLGTDLGAALAVLSDSLVRVRATLAPAGEHDEGEHVTLCSLDAVAERANDEAVPTLLLDMDAESYPCTRRDTPATVLAAKLGCAGILATRAERQRVSVRRALAGTHAGVLAFVANTQEGDEVFPAFAYDELQVELAARGAYERIGGLPTERALVANLDRAGGRGLEVSTVRAWAKHALPEDLVPYLYLPTTGRGSEVVERRFSASAIEAYLSCPYKWLVSNRARANRLDEAFGPIERGNFVHDVMQRFHERLIDAGLQRVTPKHLEACLEEMRLAFEELRADHAAGKYTHGKYAGRKKPVRIRHPYVPLSELERKQLESLVPMLEGVVRAEADMLSIFTPKLFEYSFDFAHVTYAGRPLGGRIDRIDTAPSAGAGERFVVIDYKTGGRPADMASGDPTTSEELAGEQLASWLPGRSADKQPVVQTLIYAQAYRRIAKGSPQGAAYFLTRRAEVAAMVDDALVAMEPPALPRGKVCGFPELPVPGKRSKKREGTLGFTEMLDAVEAGIATELDNLEAGLVAPAPASNSCTYCPIKMCEKRR